MILKDYLSNKPLYYEKIDYTRMPRIYEKVRSSFNIPKIIHLIGTNGKGTTGRFLASALCSLGYKTGHYTSPHILEFNERIWLNGENITDELLEASHEKLQTLLTKEDSASLSYFEYTTLLAMIAFKECDYVVMEAGLGGEFDATAVFPKILTLVTPIAYDHEAFLGTSIEEIAKTKLNAIQKSAILGYQKYDEVYDVAKKVAAERSLDIYRVEELIQENDNLKIQEISKVLSLQPYLVQNLSLSISALRFLDIDYEVSDFKDARLFGRLTRFRDNIIIDVGHNTLAAASVAEALSEDKYIIIYNSYKDKNYKKILEILKPITRHVEIIKIDDERAESVQKLHSALNKTGVEYSTFKGVRDDSKYLVFGSFSVVEAFLREYNE